MNLIKLIVYEKVFRLIAGFLFSLLLVKLLPLNEFGYYGQLTSILGTSLSLALLGLEDKLVIELKSSDIEKVRALQNAITLFKSVGFIIITTILLYIIDQIYFLFFAMLVAILVGFSSFNLTAIAVKKYDDFVKIRLRIYVISISLKIVTLLLFNSWTLIVYIFILDLILPGCIFLYLYRNDVSLKFFGGVEIFLDAFNIIRKHLLLILTSILIIGGYRLDYLLGAKSLTEEQLGIYAILLIFVTPINAFGREINNLIISNDYSKRFGYIHIICVLLLIGMFAYLCLCMTVPFILKLLYSDIEIPSHYLFLLGVSIPLNWMRVYDYYYFVSKEMQKINLYRNFWGVLTVICFYIVFQTDDELLKICSGFAVYNISILLYGYLLLMLNRRIF